MGEVVVQAHAVGRGELRQEVFAQREREVAALGDFHRVLQCLGQIGKAGGHLFRRSKILAGHKIARAAFVRQYPAAGNTHARIMRLEIVGV